MTEAKLTKQQLAVRDFRINRPYCVVYNDKHYYFLNRNYKQLGVEDGGRWQHYPDISDAKRLFFYNDESNPFGSATKSVPSIRRLRKYEQQLADFMELARTNGLVERTDFSYRQD